MYWRSMSIGERTDDIGVEVGDRQDDVGGVAMRHDVPRVREYRVQGIEPQHVRRSTSIARSVAVHRNCRSFITRRW